MVKHNQAIRRQQLTNCLGVFDHFMGFALKELKEIMETLVYIHTMILGWVSLECVYSKELQINF